VLAPRAASKRRVQPVSPRRVSLWKRPEQRLERREPAVSQRPAPLAQRPEGALRELPVSL
jgi:hypothetical protein